MKSCWIPWDRWLLNFANIESSRLETLYHTVTVVHTGCVYHRRCVVGRWSASALHMTRKDSHNWQIASDQQTPEMIAITYRFSTLLSKIRCDHQRTVESVERLCRHLFFHMRRFTYETPYSTLMIKLSMLCYWNFLGCRWLDCRHEDYTSFGCSTNSEWWCKVWSGDNPNCCVARDTCGKSNNLLSQKVTWAYDRGV